MPTFTVKLSKLINEDFDFGLTSEDYPIFDETYREGLNTKILRHYWNYEIGQETVSMFRFLLNRKMNEIMPIYNQLYLSTRIEFDPLQTMNYTDFTNTTDTKNTSGTSSNTSSSDTTSKSRSVSSTTPQVQLSNNEDYASGAADSNSDVNASADSSVTSSGTDSTTASIERTLQGSQGLPSADLLMRYRATFLNIDMMVITELETLFMQIWDNGDEFFGSEIGVYGYEWFGWFQPI